MNQKSSPGAADLMVAVISEGMFPDPCRVAPWQLAQRLSYKDSPLSPPPAIEEGLRSFADAGAP